MLKHKQVKSLFVPVLICSLASLFYLYDFVLRVIPSVMAHELMAQYQVTAIGFSFLSSFFFVGYTIMQVPCGLLYDRYGPRRLLTINCFLAAVAAFLFVATNVFTIAAIARFFMGIGSAFAYIGALVLVMRWLPERFYSMTAGIIQLMGAVGAIVGQAPLAYLISVSTPWSVMLGVSIVGLVLAILFWLFIRDYPQHMKAQIHKHKDVNVAVRLKRVLKRPQNWLIALYGFAIWAPISIFAALWDVQFLQARDHLSAAAAGTLASGVWVGVAFGGPLLGWLSGYMSSRRIPLILGASLGVIVSVLILYDPYLSRWAMEGLLMLFGVAASAQAVTFGVVQDNNLNHDGGTAAGFNNMAIVLGGAILQPVVGVMLHWHMGPRLKGMPPHYSTGDFQFALSVLPICFVIALIVSIFLIRETHCESQAS